MKNFTKKILSLLLATVLVLNLSFFSTACSDLGFDTPSDFVSLIFEKAESLFGWFFELFNPGFTYCNAEDYSENAFDMPGLDESFVPQGFCYIKELNSYAVSGYSSSDSENSDDKLSRIYLVDVDSKTVKKILLLKSDGTAFTSHAGGIASDGENVWISSGGGPDSYGSVYHLTVAQLKAADDGDKLKFNGRIRIHTKGSFLYCDDNMLWAGEFYNEDNPVNPEHTFGENDALVCGYKLPLDTDYSSSALLYPDVVLSIPDEVQGMSITEEGQVLFSSSYGRYKKSVMHIFADYKNWTCVEASTVFNPSGVPVYISSEDDYITKIKMPTLMEAFDYENGQLFVIFESGAEKYSNAIRVIKQAWKIDVDLLISQLA